MELSDVIDENSLQVDETGDDDELSDIREELAGRVTVTPLLSFDFEVLASSFVIAFC